MRSVEAVKYFWNNFRQVSRCWSKIISDEPWTSTKAEIILKYFCFTCNRRISRLLVINPQVFCSKLILNTNGSIRHWSTGRMGHFVGWVIWTLSLDTRNDSCRQFYWCWGIYD